MNRPLILALLLAAAPAASQTAAPLPSRSAEDARRYRECLAAARDAPAKAVELAAAWRIEGGGLPAQHCLALAFAGDGKPAAARTELERAARAADTARDPLAAELWGQAGNAALLAGNPTVARAHLGLALERGAAAEPPTRSGWLIDRARAAVAGADPAAARTDLDAALALSPADPVARTLSASLARRQGDLARARVDIVEARRLAPSDATVAAEAKAIENAAFERPAVRAAEPLGTTPPPY